MAVHRQPPASTPDATAVSTLTAVATQFEPGRAKTAVATPSCCCCCCCCLVAISAMGILAPTEIAAIARQRNAEGKQAPGGSSTLLSALALPIAGMAAFILPLIGPTWAGLDAIGGIFVLVMAVFYAIAVSQLHGDGRAVGTAIVTVTAGPALLVAEGYFILNVIFGNAANGPVLYLALVAVVLIGMAFWISARMKPTAPLHPPGWPYTSSGPPRPPGWPYTGGGPPPPPPTQLL